MKTVFTVACEVPGGLGEYVAFTSRASLLDADFVLFEPHIGESQSFQSYRGKQRLSDAESFHLQETINHWRSELAAVLTAGRTVFMLMKSREEVYASTGENEYSGTGRNRQITNIVRLLSNYDVIPFSTKIVDSNGVSMVLCPGEQLLREYWQQFGEVSSYQVYIAKGESFRPLVVTRHGQRVVGAILRTKAGGALVALPWINLYRDEFLVGASEDNGTDVEPDRDEGSEWTPRAVEWGKRYLRSLEDLDAVVRRQRDTTPLPSWAQDDSFRTRRELALSETLLQIQSQISELEKSRRNIEEQLENAGSLKMLLYGQGQELESAILEAMTLMGFIASTYRSSDSEFDAVLECSDGRCIGEAEGRDNRAIGIDKMRQLEVNIYEDLSRDEVSEPAKAILFGNAYRLTPPSKRPDTHFTAKCRSAARRNGTAMVRTCDLFEVARVLADVPDDEFAASCRKAIFDAAGREVEFPFVRNTDFQGRK